MVKEEVLKETKKKKDIELNGNEVTIYQKFMR